MCENLFYLFRYFYIPFINIDPSKKAIKTMQNPTGLLSKMYEKAFLRQKFNVFLHHIEGNLFRIILWRQEIFIKIDIELDQGSLKKYFEVIEGSEFLKEEISDFLQYTKESAVQKNKEQKEMLAKVLDFNKLKSFKQKLIREYSLRSFKILNESTLVAQIMVFIEETEDVL